MFEKKVKVIIILSLNNPAEAYRTFDNKHFVI